MELLLNLVWVAISATALMAWVSWRRGSASEAAPQMLPGVMVVVCILALLFPVISMSDDLSQTLGLAEGSRIQDVLKAPEMCGIDHLAAILPAIPLRLESESRAVAKSLATETTVSFQEIFWSPSIEKRPPPIV